jgi:signal transduction histidine kinase/ActR/RegA family two-component response regulator
MALLNGKNQAELHIRAGFVFLLMACGLSIFATISSERADSWVARTLRVREALIQLYSDVCDAETGQRGFLLTRDQRYLAPYTRGRSDIGPVETQLAGLVADNPEQTALLDQFRPLAARKLGELQQTIQLAAQGQDATALQLIRTNVGRELMDDIQVLTREMDRNEYALLQQRLVVARRTSSLLLAATLASVLLACLLAYRVHREGKARQQAIEQKNHALEEEIRQRESMEMRLRQVQKMEALGQLTGGIAHDFNNMLAIIVGNLELSQRRLGKTDEAIKDFLARALGAATRGADLTKRLLAFSRMQPLRPKSIDVNDCVRDMLLILQRALGEDIHIDTRLASNLWRAFIDQPQLESALLHLAVNSRDAMAGGGRLCIQTSNVQLDAIVAEGDTEVIPGQYVLVSVTDTGSGMSAEVMRRAFDPFFTTKQPGQGTGLGLSQVHGFIKQSHGHVQLESEPGKGTTVKIYLPRASAQQDAEVFIDSMLYAPRTSKKVLVVEDDDNVRQFVVACLDELGYSAIPAESADKAQQQLASHPDVHLLLTDVIMPGKNGKELADSVRPFYPKLRVVYMSGYPRDALMHNGMLDADVRLLTKPFSVQELAQELKFAFDEETV